MILNPKRVCHICNYNICKKCSQLVRLERSKLLSSSSPAAETKKKSQKVPVCFACYKKNLFEANNQSQQSSNLSIDFSSINNSSNSNGSPKCADELFNEWDKIIVQMSRDETVKNTPVPAIPSCHDMDRTLRIDDECNYYDYTDNRVLNSLMLNDESSFKKSE